MINGNRNEYERKRRKLEWGKEWEEEAERRDGTNERKERRSWHSVALREVVVFRDMYRKTASNQDLLYATESFVFRVAGSSRWKRETAENDVAGRAQ